MQNIKAPLEEGWKKIRDGLVEMLRLVSEGGDPGVWRSGLRSIAGSDHVNAFTGRPYRGALNRAILSAAIGPRLDRRVATARQLVLMGVPDPATKGIAPHARIMTPIKSKKTENDDGTEGDDRERVFFGLAAVFSVDLLRNHVAEDGNRPWEALPPFVELPPADWTERHENGALSLIPSLVAAFSMKMETGLFRSPHVILIDGKPVVRMPEAGQQEGSEETMLADRLSSFFHESAHWTGYGGAGEELRRDMTGTFGSPSYAREELVAEIFAARMMNFLGLDETENFMARKAAYVGGWSKALPMTGEEGSKLVRATLEDVERIFVKTIDALAGNEFIAERLEAIRKRDEEAKIPEAAELGETEVPDWRDADGIEALTPAQKERANASYASKKAKGAAAANGTLEDFILRAQKKRSGRKNAA
jgi:hypothetical protein